MSENNNDPLDPASWYSTENVCGSCIAWRPTEPDLELNVANGLCKLRPELRNVPATMAKCNIYKPRGQFRYSPEQVSSPKRRRNKVLKVVRMNQSGEMVRAPVPRARPQRVDAERVELKQSLPHEIDLGESANAPIIRQVLSLLMRTELSSTAPALHAKFEGGRVEVVDEGGGVQTFPVELLFAHLVRLQDSLDDLGRQLERHAGKLGEKTTADLKGYLKRMHGSMTTFNVLFQNKADHFSSK